MSELGLGVLIGIIQGNKDTVDAIKSSLGKTITKVRLDENILDFLFEDGSKLNLWDNGQSCCEQRYMTTADNLEEFAGAQLLDFELKGSEPGTPESDSEHEIEFLDVKTSKGVFQVANHNEHNGYYGGFDIVAAT